MSRPCKCSRVPFEWYESDDCRMRVRFIPYAGVHVTLPDYYSPENVGMIVPKTKDGRVVFMLPWEGTTIAGTTDSPSDVTMTPKASEADVQFILAAIADFLDVKVWSAYFD
jgi:glycerol-3-phosphate dehydrogenase